MLDFYDQICNRMFCMEMPVLGLYSGARIPLNTNEGDFYACMRCVPKSHILASTAMTILIAALGIPGNKMVLKTACVHKYLSDLSKVSYQTGHVQSDLSLR